MNRDVDLMELADRERMLPDADQTTSQGDFLRGAPQGDFLRGAPQGDFLRGADMKAKVEAIRELGELVRGRLELAADDVSDARFAAMWREIDKQIAADANETARENPDLSTGFWHRVGKFFDRYRGHVLVGAVSAGAVGALALLLRPPREGGGSGVHPGSARVIDARAVRHRPAEIDDLHTPGGVGTVFYLDDEDGSTTVIWVTPEDTVEGI